MTASPVPPELLEITRLEWRELGFFYLRDDAGCVWRLRGGRGGLQRFGQLLSDHVDGPGGLAGREPQQLGPTLMLKIGAAASPVITAQGVWGPQSRLHQLGATVQAWVSGARPGEVMRLKASFAPDAAYELQLEMQDDAFDPALAER